MSVEEGTNLRQIRSKQQEKNINEGKRVESVNSLPAVTFFKQFARDLIPKAEQFDTSSLMVQYLTDDVNGIRGSIFERCFLLIENSSAQDYETSEMKWSRPKKMKEMALPDMRYIVLLARNNAQDAQMEDSVAGFISFMITYEDGHEVVYIYEIHFARQWQGRGIGRKLMSIVEEIGRNVGVEKAMLTVFRSNSRAWKWYQNLGYVEDEFSPDPKILRNGTIKEPSYIILSKKIALA